MAKFVPPEPRYDDIFFEGLKELDRLAATGEDLADFDYPGPDLDTLTCKECPERSTCKFVDDWYNTDGDCLAYK